MTIGDLRNLIAGSDDRLPVYLYNESSEWYGADKVGPADIRLLSGVGLVVSFGGEFEDDAARKAIDEIPSRWLGAK